MAHTPSWAACSWDTRLHLKAEPGKLGQEISLSRDEARIRDARLQKIPPRHRPHDPPVGRLVILERWEARSWSYAQADRRCLGEPQTQAS